MHGPFHSIFCLCRVVCTLCWCSTQPDFNLNWKCDVVAGYNSSFTELLIHCDLPQQYSYISDEYSSSYVAVKHDSQHPGQTLIALHLILVLFQNHFGSAHWSCKKEKLDILAPVVLRCPLCLPVPKSQNLTESHWIWKTVCLQSKA